MSHMQVLKNGHLLYIELLSLHQITILLYARARYHNQPFNKKNYGSTMGTYIDGNSEHVAHDWRFLSI